MNKFKTESKLANLNLVMTLMTAVGNMLLASFFMKQKGMLFTAQILSGFMIIDRLAGLCQPLLRKVNIKIYNYFTVLIILDTLFLSIIILYLIGYMDIRTFIIFVMILHIIMNLIGAAVDMSLTAYISNLLKDKYESYLISEFTINNIGAITGVAISYFILSLNKSYNVIILMYLTILVTVILNIITFTMIKLLKHTK